jgi:hypothetical protein
LVIGSVKAFALSEPKRDGEIESAIGTVGDLIPGIPHAWRVINRDLIFDGPLCFDPGTPHV